MIGFGRASIIVSADDFGLTEGINEAVEIAHRQGALTQASLMVAAPAAADAIGLAKAMPDLNIGLHLVLVEGDSVLGHGALPRITDPAGRFGADQAARGFRYFFSPGARRELRAEIRAQFEAFRATGLTLHHADTHKHMHLHPTIARLIIEIGRDYGLTRLRVPAEPPATIAACGDTPTVADRALYAWSRVLRAQVTRAGLTCTDHVFGIKWSGRMTPATVRTLLAHLPAGSSEIYFHPATRHDRYLHTSMPDYRHEDEFRALLECRFN